MQTEMQLLRMPPVLLREYPVDDVVNDNVNLKIDERVQLLRVGTFYHPKLGELNITQNMLKSMVKNFENNVRGIDISIDYKHESEDIAAGWVTALELSEDAQELWAVVKWTPRGEKKIAEREFRYLSADFHMNYMDNETLAEFGPTLFGAGLTNRPVVKRMQPAIELSEVKAKDNQTQNGGNSMDEKKLAELEAANKELKETADKYVKLSEELQEEMNMSPEEMVAEIKRLKALIEQLQGQNKEMEDKAELAEKNKKFDVLLSEGKACEAQRESYISGDIVKFSELASDVNLEAKGSEEDAPAGQEENENENDAQDKLIELAEKLADEQNIPFENAVSVVLSENPKLRKAYEGETSVYA